MSNKIIVHYCGGAGINVAREINKSIAELGAGFADIDARYIDTSENNIGGLDREHFYKVGVASFTGVEGSGGERRTNSIEIISGVKNYLDEYGYSKDVVGEYHIAVFSGSGGSGSVIAPTLISNLRTRGIPVLGILIGDSSNGLSCKNTLNTLATLDHMAKKTVKKPITIIYYNNHNVDGAGIGDKESVVNTKIFNALSVLSLFLSGDNDDIDTKDMNNFLSPDKYSTITIKPSVYCLEIFNNDNVVNNQDTINLIGRTLSTPNQDTDIGITLLQHKYGKIVDENAINTMGIITPLHMVLTGNCLVKEHKILSNTVNEYESIMNSVKTDDLLGSADADDDGMIF